MNNSLPCCCFFLLLYMLVLCVFRHSLLNQVRSIFGMVRASKGYLNSHSLKLLYYTMIQSKIQYCITTWCHGNKTIKNKLQNTCNKYIKLINKKQPKVNGSIKSFPFLSIDQLLSKEIATFKYKFNNKLLPKTFENFFQLNQCNNRATVQEVIAKLFQLVAQQILVSSLCNT